MDKVKKSFIKMTGNKLSEDINSELKVVKPNTPINKKGFILEGYWPQDKWPVYKKVYRVIPRNPRYGISKEGKVYDSVSGKIVKVGDRSGYMVVNLVSSWYRYTHGKERVSYSPVHRLIAVCWVENDDWKNKYLVRHKDDDKHNIEISNLAWGNHRDNSKDASVNGNVAFSKAVFSKDHRSGLIQAHSSLANMCKYFELNLKSVYTLLQVNPYRVLYGYLEVRVNNDVTEFIKSKKDITRRVQIFIHKSKEVKTFNSIKEASVSVGRSETLITKLLSSGENTVRNGLSARLSSDEPWDKNWIDKTHRKYGICIKYPCGKEKRFNSLRELDKVSGFSRKLVSKYIKLNKPYNGVTFKKFEIK